MRPWLAFYLGAMGAKRRRTSTSSLADRYGDGDAARGCRTGSWPATGSGAAVALTDELIDAGRSLTTPTGSTTAWRRSRTPA